MKIGFTDRESQLFQQLKEAAWTLQSLPADPRSRPGGLRSAWPEMSRKSAVIYGGTRRNSGPRPAPKAIDEMDHVLDQLARMVPGERQILWARANGIKWSRLVQFTGRSRSSLHRDLKRALSNFGTNLGANLGGITVETGIVKKTY